MVGGLEYGPEESGVTSGGSAPEWESGPDATAADTPEAAGEEVVYAEDLVLEDMRESGEGLGDGPTDPEEAQADAASDRAYSRKQMDDAIRQKMRHAERNMRREMERDPAYQLGREMLAQRARAEGLTEQEARKMIVREQEVRISPEVERAAANMPTTSTIQRQLAANPAVARIGKELLQCVLDGELPAALQVQEYVDAYPDFLNDCTRYGVKAALRATKAAKAQRAKPKRAPRTATRNDALPRSTRPAYNDLRSGGIDYREMSDEQFRRVKAKMKEAQLQGKTIRY